MLVSILCTSYKRFDRLLKMIDSVYETANPSNFEILVRLSLDDKEAICRKNELGVYSEVKVIWGEQMRGYRDHYKMLTELLSHATGEWFHIIDDDMTI